jgi:transcription elongation factor
LEEAKKAEKGNLETKKEKDLSKTFILFRRQLFRKGFLYKAFPIKQLELGVGVRPGVEEVQAFSKIIDENKSGIGKR